MHQRFAATIAIVVGGIVLAQLPANGGVLQFGQANIQGNNITVPVVLEGDVGSGVSAMDFTLTYDPDVLEPVRVTTGAAADAADKNVQFNLIEPGRCKVVMMGLNQGVVSGGEVATVVMRRVSSDAASAELAVVDPTLADLNATAIPSQGSTETLEFVGKPQDNDTTPDAQQDRPDSGNPNTNAGNNDTAKPNDRSTVPAGAEPVQTTVGAPSADGGVAPTDIASAFPVLPRGIDPGEPGAQAGALAARPVGPLAAAVPPGANGRAQLPQGIRPDGTDSGAGVAQPETADARSGAPIETPGTVPPNVERPDQLAMTSPGAVLPASPVDAAPKTVPAATPTADASSGRGFGLTWFGLGVIVLVLAGLFAVRRRLFT